MKEDVLRAGEHGRLIGIVTDPAAPDQSRQLPAVLLLNPGIVHRVGPHRLYVKLARRLATAGHVVFRFDLSGVGDSPVRTDHLPFERSAVDETRQAMTSLEHSRGARTFVLMGLCSGGVAAFAAAGADGRVSGAVLINTGNHLHNRADDRLDQSLRKRALARHYWRLALFSSFSRKTLRRAASPRVDRSGILRSMLTGLPLPALPWPIGPSRAAAASTTALRSVTSRGCRLLHLFSEGDQGLDYLREVLGRRFRARTRELGADLEIIRGADHTFTPLWAQERLFETVLGWMGGCDRSRGDRA